MTEQATNVTAPEGTPAAPTPPEPGEIARSMQAVLDRKSSLEKREQQQSQVKGMEAEYNQLLWLADNQPVEFLKRRGHTLDALQENNDGQSSVIDQMVNKIETLSERLERQEAERVRAQEQASEAATNAKMSNWLQNNATEYPRTAAAGGGSLVLAKMQESYDKSGRIMSEAEAAQAVENDLTQFLDTVAPAAGYVKAAESEVMANSNARSQTIHSGMSEGTVSQDLDKLTGRAKLEALLRKHNV